MVRRKDRMTVAVSRAAPGNHHDARAWEEPWLPDKGYNVIGDGGYQGSDTVTSPCRGKGNTIIKDKAYTRFRRKRATAEHVLAELKTFQCMRQIRRKGDNIDVTIRATSVLHNFSKQQDSVNIPQLVR